MAIHSNISINDMSSTTLSRYAVTKNINKTKMFGDGISRSGASSATSKRSFKEMTTKNCPYLCPEVAGYNKMPSRRLFRKPVCGNKISLSLPLPIHKANSDEIAKVKPNGRKKVKKSVLTLPNDAQATVAQVTVSDMNESEYDNVDNKPNQKYKKRVHRFSRKTNKRVENKDYHYYDRDEVYCTQLDIDLNRSSSDILGGTNMSTKKLRKGKQNDMITGNIWAILKNMNPFQYRPSPVISEESFVDVKKRKCSKKPTIFNDSRLYKTKKTEEFAYISSMEINTENSSSSISRSSSFDRVTVIDKKDTTIDTLESSLFEQSFSDCKRTPNSKKTFTKAPVKKIHKDNDSSVHRNNLLITLPRILNDKDICSKKNAICIEPIKTKVISNKESSVNKLNNTSARKITTKNFEDFKSRCSDPPIDQENSGGNLNGTKYSLHKIVDILDPNERQRKSRLVTTMPSTNAKMTVAEIKRRLTMIRFPVIILGKDQLSSTIRVEEYTPLHLAGLDANIWPFMTQWTKATKRYISPNIGQLKQNNNELINNLIMPNNRKHITSNNILNQPLDLTKSKEKNKSGNTNMYKIENKNKNDKGKIRNIQPKLKIPIKDKMLKFLYKNSSENNNEVIDCQNCEDIMVTDKNIPKNCRTSKDLTLFSEPNGTKSKWSSEFIDNVIMKIKHGVYYNHSDLHEDVSSPKIDKGTDSPVLYQDAIVQTFREMKTIATSNIENIANSSIQDNSSSTEITQILKSIPGFDHNLPNLKIETLKQNQVVVKHCLANVLIKFDVSAIKSVESNTNNILQIPLSITATSERVYKYTNHILNATLPEQLCTILPNIINNLLNSPNHIVSLNSVPKSCDLISIPEFPYNETKLNICLYPKMISNVGQVSNKLIEKKLSNLIKGTFKMRHALLEKRGVLNCPHSFMFQESTNILSKIRILDNNYFRIESISYLSASKNLRNSTVLYSANEMPLASVKNPCTAVVPYTGVNNHLSIFARAYFASNDKYSQESCMLKISSQVLGGFNINMCSMSNLAASIIIKNNSGNQMYRINSLLREFTKYLPYKVSPQINAIENDINHTAMKTQVMEDVKHPKVKYTTNNKNRRIARLIKRYKKTKAFKLKHNYLIPLKNIRRIDDYFQVLGLRKMLVNVLDGEYCEKIMSALHQMKTWIEEISFNQAFLVLMLINKKESPNLMRCRSIILQGIAVNRITLASEIDMEIEVIEREKLYPKTEYEGLSYLAGSDENYDNLFQELCWIAKTTAADHQKPFDDNTKKLLKSLLVKRKALNPSYLRVMARYVGLGLLKPQGRLAIKQSRLFEKL